MLSLRVFCMVAFISVISAKKGGSLRDIKQANKLYAKLLTDYNKDVRPVGDADESLDVKFSLSLIEVLEISESSGHMTTNMWLRMSWNDVSLRWNPADFGGVNQLHIPAKDMWVPDIVMFNGFEAFINKDLDAIVSFDGSVMWVPPAIVRLTCRHEFRGNTWVCPMRFGSWTYSGDQLNIVPYNDIVAIDDTNYISNDQWQIVDGAGKREVIHSNGVEIPLMEYQLRLKNNMHGMIRMGRK